MDICKELTDQLQWHWENQARPRLDGLTDEEYFWEPVPGCWSVRPRGMGSAPLQVGGGDYVIEFAIPEPVPAPVTTIAWRFGHILVGVLGQRLASHFGGAPVTYETFHYPATAADALEQLDVMYADWSRAVSDLSLEEMSRAVGPAEGPFAEAPMGALVQHINREMIHHLSEMALLRDLWAHRFAGEVTSAAGA
ncbi:hypothetical protein BJ994_001919 [Arthrobacter pigmenti]|uniref:DinB-like domain-containing protein n=1 Tax=Arthrobacter pigmenti TaxID=271432 RepID=A0A846RI56_9MICC|nr:DinB family protein [Arthrobacter pigmenti]NJC22843.1 hypothetical protein [Arthrobacter pigmenti]